MTSRHLLSFLEALTPAQWRCLRVVSEVADVAHAARKLHCAQALLKAPLANLQAHLGVQHIALVGEGVQLSQVLQDLLRQHPLCGAETPAVATASSPASPAPAGFERRGEVLIRSSSCAVKPHSGWLAAA